MTQSRPNASPSNVHHNRYLKFKFLSHYGDEFYCTVTQVKVHGSTMMESFQHEWQQSSAEVREVQDSLMLNKKENVKIATAAAGSSGNGTGATAAAPPLGVDSSSSVSDDNLAPTRVAPTLHSNIATQLATPTPAAVVASASGEGGVGHRPHAASAATVPPLTEKRAVAGGDAGPGELMVEDIVRGVPVEMVVPATPCSGRTEADGTCREGVLGDIADDGRAEAGKAESNVLAAEVPTMGAAGARPNDAGANSISRADVPARSGAGAGGIGAGGVGESVEGSGVGDKRTSEGNVGVDAVGVDKASDGAAGVRGEGRGEQAELGVGGLVEETPGVVGGDEQGHETVAGAIDSNVDGGGGSDVGEASAQPTQGEEAEEPPPRKGIITSTMEAISKAVGGSDGAKKRKSEEDKATDDGNTAGSGASSASTAGMSGSDSPAVGDSVQGDKGLGMDDPRGSASLEVNQGGAPSEISQNAGQVGAVDAPDDSGINPVGVVVLAAVAADVSSHEAPTSACEGAGPGVTVPAGQGLAGDSGSPNGNAVSDTTVNHLYSRHDVMSEAYDHPNKGNDVSAEAVGARGPGGVPPPSRVVVEPGETREGVMASGGANVNANVDVVNGASNTDVQATVTDDSKVGPGMGSKGDSAEVLEGTGYVAGSHAAATASADAAHPASSMRDGHQPGVQVPSVSVSVQTGSGHQHLQPDGQQDQRFAGGGGGGGGDTSVPGQGGESGSPERVVELTDAARAAVCLDRLSFSEFRDEVLARTQQGQQSANGGVAIGGQYDSIFKTLMNKIKTLEINQSLFSLYIGETHARREVPPIDCSRTSGDRMIPSFFLLSVFSFSSVLCRSQAALPLLCPYSFVFIRCFSLVIPGCHSHPSPISFRGCACKEVKCERSARTQEVDLQAKFSSSLHSYLVLPSDEVHACYQDVIEFILAEQERAQASRLALLSAHSTSLMKMGDQWPGIQELQVQIGCRIESTTVSCDTAR